jgi:CheY-like chemotaxis protein
MLVDDDEDDADLFCEEVASLDPAMKCYKAENGAEVFDALARLRPDKPDVIFLDINMPVMDGWECLRRLKNEPAYSQIPVIMYSTSSARQDVDMAYSLGALAFMSKPEDMHELSNILGVVAKTPQDLLLNHLKSFKSIRTRKLA